MNPSDIGFIQGILMGFLHEHQEHRRPIQKALNILDKEFEASQASRTPIKWPTSDDVNEAAVDKFKKPWDSTGNFMLHMASFKDGVQWLKSFVEKGGRE